VITWQVLIGGNNMLKIEELNNFNQLEELKDTWNIILSKSKNNEVFSTWEWLSCWWKHFGKERKLKVLIVRDANEIIGIAPLMLSNYHYFKLGKLRKIEFIGSPQSDYNNFILLRREQECLRVFLNYLIERCSDWDYLQLTDISEGSSTASFLYKVRNCYPIDYRVVNLCHYIDLPNSFEIFLNGLSKNMRRNLRKRIQKLNKTYDVEVKTQNDFSSIREAMSLFFLLHQKRWRSKGKAGAFNKKEIIDFHIDLAENFARKGWLSLYFLTLNDQPVAAIYSFDYCLKKYGYLSGFDPNYGSYGIGNILRMYVVEDCIKRGLKVYDLARGDEPYKSDWTRRVSKNLEVQLQRNGLFVNLYILIRNNEFIGNFFKRTWKYWKEICIME
jgi:CelD/BcsL family acetyltransferase involved in cellulose biosynthesis